MGHCDDWVVLLQKKSTRLQVNALEDALKKCLGRFQSYSCYKLRETSFNWWKGHFQEGLESPRRVLSTGPCWKKNIQHTHNTITRYIHISASNPSYDEKACPKKLFEACRGSSVERQECEMKEANSELLSKRDEVTKTGLGSGWWVFGPETEERIWQKLPQQQKVGYYWHYEGLVSLVSWLLNVQNFAGWVSRVFDERKIFHRISWLWSCASKPCTVYCLSRCQQKGVKTQSNPEFSCLWKEYQAKVGHWAV